MYRVEAAFQLGQLSQPRVQERWVTAAEVVTSMGRHLCNQFAFGDAGFAAEVVWFGPGKLLREAVEDSEEEDEDSVAGAGGHEDAAADRR